MPISLSCDCGRALRVKDELAGKKIRCPECKSILGVPAKKNEADDVVLEVLPAEDDEATPRRSSRRAAIQTEVRPARRRTLEDEDEDETPSVRRRSDDDPPSEKRSKSRDIKRRTSAATVQHSGFGSVNAGVAGGVLMMIIAVVWFIGGAAVGVYFIYPPIMFVLGIIAIVKGGLGNN